jgi:signal recognition particle GTPase
VTLQKTNNSIEDLVGNEKNECLIPDPNRTMINITDVFNDVHKKFLKENIMNELTEILMEKLQEMVKQKVQDIVKQYQDATSKKLEKIWKQLNELRQDFNKFHSETKEAIKKRNTK